MRYSLGVKLATLLLATLSVGFGLLLAASLQQQGRSLERQARRRAEAVADVFAANLRNVMLTGDGVLLARLLADIRELETIQELRLFDPRGREVYPDRAPLLAGPADRDAVHAALIRYQSAGRGVASPDAIGAPHGVLSGIAAGRRSSFPGAAGRATPLENAALWRSLELLPNETDCRPCHPSGLVRGALLLTTRESSEPAALAHSVALGIRHAMLSQRAESVPRLLADLNGTPDLSALQVFDARGRLRYATDGPPPTPRTLQAIRRAGRARTDVTWSETGADGVYRAALVLLQNDRLCHACHSAGDRTRGAVVAVTRARAEKEAGGARLNRLLAASLNAGVRNIMLSGKGSAVQRYVDGFRRLPGVDRLHVFNPAAEEVYPGARGNPAPAPPQVARLLQTGVPESRRDPQNRAWVRFQPLENEEACQRCHRKEDRYRGVIMSSVSLREIDGDVALSRAQSLAGFALTMLLVCVVLLIFVAAAVVRPIRVIGGVAERVGEGDLEARAEVKTHDEIEQLAGRINQMIDGLRAKLHMEKFVPPSAVALIERSAAAKGVALGGERQDATLLFCDIRGFTTFSEEAQPEEVVRLVNAYLEEQARIITAHGGEVDKYMGDATMAVFTGPTMARDAVRCGLALRDALAAGPEHVAPGRSVGIGINTGPVVRGTVGSPDRMEYTALGDAVNVAKRLCDAAGPGEVLISAATYDRIADAVRAEALGPLVVKGRRQPVSAYRLLAG